MTSNEIRDFHHARTVLDLEAVFKIPRDHINEVMEKVAKTAQDYDWRPFQKELMNLHHQLAKYRELVCKKSDAELEAYRKTRLPQTLEKQLHVLYQADVKEMEDHVGMMLEDPDWAPCHAKLAILKLRIDLLKNATNIEKIDLIGLNNLILGIALPTLNIEQFSNIDVSSKIGNDLFSNNVDSLKGYLEKNSRIIFNRCINIPLLCFACETRPLDSSAMIQLLIRAGADVNAGIQTQQKDLMSPLEGAFKCDDLSTLSIHKEVLSLLLRSGADPNLRTKHPLGTSPGSFLIYKLIFRTDNAVDELLPLLVDAGMDVNAFQIDSVIWSKVDVDTPLLYAIEQHEKRYVRNANGTKEFLPTRLNFIKALIFNNATVHEAAKNVAYFRKGCVKHLNKCLQIRESVLNDLMSQVKTYLNHLPIVITQLILNYWTPHVPEMRARCYDLLSSPPQPPSLPPLSDQPAESRRSSWCSRVQKCTIS